MSETADHPASHSSELHPTEERLADIALEHNISIAREADESLADYCDRVAIELEQKIEDILDDIAEVNDLAVDEDDPDTEDNYEDTRS